eukprot:TRINITY_DN3186_c0_g1_i1.p1 TRINITY_DN3186_c0_g1~~TRINITY_DN3186_c0_g1_i1.p1  ORF type:complete len:467 (+),score=75.15 TRINITY_DN3186_c0_g1_i1:51-1403(+)
MQQRVERGRCSSLLRHFVAVVATAALLLCLVATVVSSKSPGNLEAVNYYSVYYNNHTHEFSIASGKDEVNGVAFGYYIDEINETGWSTLFIATNNRFEDSLQSYAAGYLEGVLTSTRIYQNKRNFFTDIFGDPDAIDLSPPVVAFLEANEYWITNSIANAANTSESSYWTQVGLIVNQLDGLCDGYNSVSNQTTYIPRFHFLLLNLAEGDMPDILAAYAGYNNSLDDSLLRSMSLEDVYRKMTLESHCSAIVKLTEDDLYSSHNTWTDYACMLRIFKTYQFAFKSLDMTYSHTFSSYPGLIYSNDDFYMIQPSKLVVTETTNTVLNYTVYQYLTVNCVFYFYRVVVANRLAWNGSDWINIFTKYNSGTYNNQMIIVDYKKFTPNETLPAGTVMIVEQMPGDYYMADVSSIVNEQKYWPSYNRPYFPEVFEALGYSYLTVRNDNNKFLKED